MKNTTLRILFLSMLIIAVSTLNVKSQVLMYDNFNYPAGDSMIWHNWLTQQTSLTNAILVANEGLSYTGYICSGIGNAAAIGTSGQDVFRGFTKQTLPGSTLYMACLAKVTTGATGDAFITFKESPTSPTNLNYRGRVYAKVDGSNNLAFGISKGAITAPASANYTPASYSLNTTYLLVVRYNIVEGTGNDSAFLFVNPIIASPEPAPSVTATDISASDLGLGSVLLRQGTAGSSPTVIVDGVRVAKTWYHALNVSDIATLSDLRVDASTVSGFNPNIFSYNDTVPAGQTSVTVLATNTDWAATQTLNLATSIPGVSAIQVTSENGLNTNTYTVTHAYAYHTVSVSAAPASTGSVSGGGIYGEGLSATVMATPASSYIFLNWTQNGSIISTSANYTFTVTAPVDLVANFVPNALTVSALPSPPEGGTITGAGTVSYGATTTLTAIPNAAYDFLNWTENGNVLGTNTSLTLLNITSNRSITGNFLLKIYNITTTASPVEGGIVTGGTACTYGSTVTLSAVPNNGYIFENWKEAGVILGTDPVLVLSNVTANHDIVGNFVVSVNTYTVTGIAVPTDAGSVSGSGNVVSGSAITLTATANSGYAFYNWTEGTTVLGTNPTITISNVTANHTLHANFLSTVGIAEKAKSGLRVYPTMSSGILNVEAPYIMNTIEVFDASGVRILILLPKNSEYIFNFSGFREGLYFLRIASESGIETAKFFVMK